MTLGPLPDHVARAQQGATIINIQNINTTGAIDDETAEKIGRALKRAGNSRET